MAARPEGDSRSPTADTRSRSGSIGSPGGRLAPMSRDRCLRRENTGGAGFTLLEVVVALAIAALALVTLFQTGSGGLFAADTAARIDEAIERAQSHLAAVGRAGPIAPGELTGDDGGGYRWR